VLNISSPSFRESGSAIYALNVQSHDETNVVISPMVEFGGRYDTGWNGFVLRAYADTGVSLLPGNTHSVDASLAGAAPGDGVFTAKIDSPNVLGDFDFGLQLYQAAGFELKADYNVQTGSRLFTQGGTFRLAYHF
jgi:uncharacterized protein with beta-barrel porin domain